jgi:hypothetical protein
LTSHARQAYLELGGIEYLKRNPSLLNAILTKQVPAASPRLITAESHAEVIAALALSEGWMREISHRRLAYQIGSQVSTDLNGFERVLPAPAEPAPDAQEPRSTPGDRRVATDPDPVS